MKEQRIVTAENMENDNKFYPFTDDFMFCTVLSRNRNLCIRFLELVLGVKIKDISYIKSQESMDNAIDSKGIRLDVYVDDTEGTVYDIEMQTGDYVDLPKRSRYYQGMIDLTLLEKGGYYRNLKKSYVLFICTKDPFDKKLGRYTLIKKCEEDPALEYDDGSRTVYINAEGTNREELGEELWELMNYLKGNPPESTFTKEIEKSVNETNKDSKWRKTYMTYKMHEIEKYEEGREEGRKEGCEEGMEKGLLLAVKEGYLSVENAAILLKQSVSHIKALAEG